MGREIKFRAFFKNQKRFVYGDLLQVNNKCFINQLNYADFDDIDFGRCFHEVEKDTIGQFTGLKDKNGKKIFEGDRIREGIVIFHNEYLGFFVEMNDDFYEKYKPLYDVVLPEITGNIHDA
jgi:uncharacterized phage protein (TIGR01671 family)